MYHIENNIIRTEDTPLDESVLGGTGHVFFKYMKKHGNRKAQIDAITGQTDTFHTLLQKCVRTSIALRKLGITKGDVITYYSGIHINACVPVIASYFLGVIPSFLDVMLPLSEASYLLQNVKPKLLLTDLKYFNKIKNAMKNKDMDIEIVIFDDDFFKDQSEEACFKPIYVSNLEETTTVAFSSGSTGFPKGICLNHYVFLCSNITEREDFRKESETLLLLSYDSLYWTVELMRLLTLTRQGACRLINPHDFDATEAWHLIEKFKVNIAFLIPPDIIQMYKVGKSIDLNCSSLTTIVSEGSYLPKNYIIGLQKILPDMNIFQCYGQTEVGLLTKFCNTDLHIEYNRRKIGSVGLPVQGYGISYKVVDLHSGENLGPNKPGELRVKSKTTMTGYCNQDNSDQFDEDGWLRTGDVVYYDEDYCFFIVDRIKEMLIYKGWHIQPAFLETELMTHPAVQKAVVIGIPHDTDGEHPLAVVILNENFNNITSNEIEKYLNERVSQRDQLRGGLRFTKNIPVTVTGKPKRRELKRMVLSDEI